MDLTDKQWDLLKIHIPEEELCTEPRRGRAWFDSRKALNGILWILKTGAQWKTKWGKGGPPMRTKIMGIVDRSELPVAIGVEPATPHETHLAEKTVEELFINVQIGKLIGDKAYDSDPLDEKVSKNKIELIAPHKSNRVNKTQDGRKVRQYKNRWKVERFFAWLQNFRRIVTRFERKSENFEAMVLLGCALILLRRI